MNKILLDKKEIEYFRRGEVENPRFWSRLGGEPNFKNKVILDIGCGHGSLCLYMVKKGAKKVIGIDINEKLIKFAKQNIELNFPKFINNLEFKYCDISKLRNIRFDIIVSKSTFEHIINLPKCLSEIKLRLKDNGKIFIGFGPLYNSPFGDHRRLKAKIPWGHLIFSEKSLINKLNKGGIIVNKVEELGLNKLSLRDYKNIFLKSGLKVEMMNINVSKNLISKIFSLIAKIPILEEYFSHNLYCVLSKRID